VVSAVEPRCFNALNDFNDARHIIFKSSTGRGGGIPVKTTGIFAPQMRM
jgi:hypothetical protein